MITYSATLLFACNYLVFERILFFLSVVCCFCCGKSYAAAESGPYAACSRSMLQPYPALTQLVRPLCCYCFLHCFHLRLLHVTVKCNCNGYCGLLPLHGQVKHLQLQTSTHSLSTKLLCPPAMYIFQLQLSMLACNLPARLLPLCCHQLTCSPATYLSAITRSQAIPATYLPRLQLTLFVYNLAASQQPNVVRLQLSLFLCIIPV